jgi:tetratricopeptide (TPR) repeat protein
MFGKLVRHRLFPYLVLVVLTCVAYVNALNAPFVFDDLVSVRGNRLVHFFSFDRNLLSTRSLLYMSYAFNYWLGGDNVFGYHVVDLLLHILAGLLVFAIAHRIYGRLRTSDSILPEEETRARVYALFAAAFFLLHPLQTEAVTYISERSELLSKLVYLCGLFIFMLIPEKKIGFMASVPVMFFLALGLGFKETAITLPVAIALYDFIFLSHGELRNMLRRWRFYAGLAIIGAAGAYAFSEILRRPLEEVGIPGTLRPLYYFLTEIRVTARYLRLIFFPVGQNLDYEFPPVLSPAEPGLLLSALLIVVLLFAAWRWRKAKPVYAFSILWFFMALVPTAGIVPIPDVIFEHRLYLPLAGICLSFPMLLELVSANRTRLLRIGGVLVGILLIMTMFRNYVWADELRLFSDVVSKSPHKLRAYENLIFAYMKRGEEEQAISVAKAALPNLPDHRISLLDTLGNLYLRLGRPAEAVEVFKASNDESVQIGAFPAFLTTSFNNLGVAYMALAQATRNGDATRTDALRRARDAFAKSKDVNPSDLGVLNSYVTATYELGEATALEQDLRKTLERNPADLGTLYMLATLLSLADRQPESIPYFKQATDQENRNALLYFNYAFALSQAGQKDRAMDQYTNALRVDPVFHEAHYNLALIYLEKKDYPSAVQHLNAIVSLEAANVRANLKLAEIYAYQGKLPLARQYLQQVFKVSPSNREALSLFAKIGS